MPFYNDLRPSSDEKKQNYGLIFPDFSDGEKKRTIANILRLRETLSKEIPTKSSDRSLLLASWNIKEFGHLNERLPESYYYIAEVIARFDLVAVQEIKSKLDDLKRIMKLLGSSWKYIITDITEGREGNRERFAYIYDTRKVKPSGLSGEIVLWDKLTTNSKIKQLKRSPAITGFKAGWKSFSIINVHLHPGNSTNDREYRKEEIRLLLEALNEKKKRKHLWNENLIVLGDTNLYKNNKDSVKLFDDAGYIETESLKDKNTNVSDSEIYDRIFLSTNSFFKLIHRNLKESANVLDVFDIVYREEDRKNYHDFLRRHKDNPTTLKDDEDYKKYFHQYWKRSQISDHNPVWMEIEIDSSDDFLETKLKEFK